ncbi:hypothetical protein HB779_11330 [Phyllobacterium sp. 628]|uniref:hypothetical protein n=1 Tax=Phyllobacterium sp. 628 TaxID=2718938 RepID=UPI001662619B|nr:hypothetical protein [Phyllobacterium sp. 628]QND52429.1 hypothetical protein HB779_11330 [Phyllobacterium sp. 628]
MLILRLFSKLAAIWRIADEEARQLALLADKPDTHLPCDAGITREQVEAMLRWYRLKRIGRVLAKRISRG